MTRTHRIDGTEHAVSAGADTVATSLRLGYKASAEQFGPIELLDFSIHAEEVGFDSVVVSDHFQPWHHRGGDAPFPFAWPGALGAKTNRIQIGTSVLTPTFRYHPLVVSQAMGTLGVLFPKRVMSEIGTGESLNEVTYKGTYYKTYSATIYDRPPGAIPLLSAPGGAQMPRYSGRVDDGMIVTSGKGAELYRDQLLPAFEEGARAAKVLVVETGATQVTQ